jgi:hypothetical protein
VQDAIEALTKICKYEKQKYDYHTVSYKDALELLTWELDNESERMEIVSWLNSVN